MRRNTLRYCALRGLRLSTRRTVERRYSINEPWRSFTWVSWLLNPPMARFRASQGLGKSPKGSGQGVRSQPRVQGRALGWHRPKPEKRSKVLAPSGVSFSLLLFSWPEKRKYADCGSGTAIRIYYIDWLARQRDTTNSSGARNP